MYVIRFECPPFGDFFERFKATALRQKEFHVFCTVKVLLRPHDNRVVLCTPKVGRHKVCSLNLYK